MKENDYEIIPDLPKEIMNECLKPHSDLLIFIGAGLSKLVGYPLWNDLANEVLNLCKNNTKISDSEIEIVRNNYDAINKITFASTILQDISKVICKKLTKKRFTKTEIKKKNTILRSLNSFKATIVTTNADTTLDEINNISHDWKIYKTLNKEAVDYAKRFPAVIHMHGSVEDPNSLVFTLDEYAKKYSFRSKDGFGNELANLFSINENKTILFIGYSLREFEMLQYILGFDEYPEVKRNIFKLDGYYKYEETKFNVDEKYYKSLGIKLLRYSREIKNYDKLIDVLVEWSNRIELQQNVFQHPDYSIKRELDKKPDYLSKQYVLKALNSITDETYFASNLIGSNYFKEWMKILSKTDLFDAKKHFQPCTRTDENLYSSSYWDGLNIIESYIRKYGNDLLITKLVKNILKQCVELFKEDENITDIYLKRNTSFSILHFLVDIIFSSSEYLENKKVFKTVLNNILSSPFYRTEHLVYKLYESRQILVNSKPDCVLWIYEKIIKNMADSFDYNKYFKYKEMSLIIQKAPEKFFSYAKKILLKEEHYYLMGSFYDYDSIDYLRCDKFVPTYYLKESSKYIDIDVLSKEINELLNSKNEYANRMGLCLLNINFERSLEILKNNAESIFNNEELFSDLLKLFEINQRIIGSNKEIFDLFVKLISKSNFNSNKDKNDILKRGLFDALKPIDFEGVIKSVELSKIEKKQILNYNKLAYSEPIDSAKYIDQFYNSIKDASINEFRDVIVQKYSKLSSFYHDYLFGAIDMFLCQHEFSTYIKYVRDIFPNYFGHFLSEIAYGSKIKTSSIEKRELIATFTKEDYESHIDSVLTIFEKLLNDDSLTLEEKCDVIKIFKFRQIKLEDVKLSESKIDVNVTHGNSFYRYFKLLLNIAKKAPGLKSFLISTYEYFKNKYGYYYVFIFDICMEYDALLNIDCDYFYQDIDLYFKEDSTYQFYALAFVSNLSLILDRLKSKTSFIEFIDSKNNENEYKVNVLFRILAIYVKNGSYSHFKNHIILNGNPRIIENLFESLWTHNNLLKENSFRKRLEDLTIRFKKTIANTEGKEKYDRLIYVLSRLIIETNGEYGFLWDLLITLSYCAHDHIFEETIELINKFKESHVAEIRSIIEAFTVSILNNKISYFSKLFIDVLNDLYSSDQYQKDCVDIKRRLTGADIKLNTYFKF